jgi:ABC-2 type transport system ATP-binding protein
VNSRDAFVRADHLSRSFGRRVVLKDVTFAARGGELVGIVGENGSGKTTLLRVLAGLLSPDRGALHLRGRVGYCPQDPQVHLGLTVAHNLEWFQAAYGRVDRGHVDRLLHRLGLDRFRGMPVAALSGGTRQKLNLVLALMHDPDVLLLDEPYQGFDWETYLRFWEIADAARRAGKLILVISHLVFEQHRFARVLRLHDGVLESVPAG